MTARRSRTVLVAPDSFKGTLTATAVADAIGSGLRTAGWHADLAPVADGGEGTAAVLAEAAGARWVPATVPGPLDEPVPAGYYFGADGCVWLDCAAASGLASIPAPTPRTAWEASSAGTGHLLLAARRAGAARIVLGVGGSATTDGGRGAVEVVLAAGGLSGTRLQVLCDVTTEWSDAAAVFGPQKGADADTVRRLADRLEAYAEKLPRDPRGMPMSGAAGGLAGGLWAALDAELLPGAAHVLGVVHLAERAASATAVITGEGRFDTQSLLGKVVSAVQASTPRPVHLVVGSSELTETQARSAGFASLTVASDLRALFAAGSRFRP